LKLKSGLVADMYGFRAHDSPQIADREPIIKDNDIIIVDREGIIDNGDIVATLTAGQLYLGYLRKIVDEVYVENNEGRIKFDECQIAAPVIEIIRRLK